MPYQRVYKKTFTGLPPASNRSQQRISQARAVTLATRRATAAPSNVRTGGFEGKENKFLDCNLAATAVTGTWATYNPTAGGCVDSLSVPAQGNGESQRDGRVYYINSIHLRGLCKMASTESQVAPTGNSYLRIVLYWDTQTNATEAAGSDVMQSGGAVEFNSFRNLENSKRFIVLKDKVVKCTPQHMNEGAANLFATSEPTVTWSMNKSFKKGIKVRCSGTTANVASVTDSNLGLACVSVTEGQNPFISYQCRIRFSG